MTVEDARTMLFWWDVQGRDVEASWDRKTWHRLDPRKRVDVMSLATGRPSWRVVERPEVEREVEE